MKIAGRKNDGAWFRTNKFLTTLSAPHRAQLKTVFVTNFEDQTAAAFAEIQSLASTVGVTVGESVGTADAWLDQMLLEGIPRQVWYGKYTFMTYSKVAAIPPATGFRYVPDFGPQLFAFSKLLRRFLKNYIFGLRNFNDQTNQGALGNNNPGGLPNADKTS